VCCLAGILGLMQTTDATAGGCTAQAAYTLLIHGGFVGYSERVQPHQLELLKSITRKGRARLAAGASAVDAVTEAIVAMEDSGAFDAGKGSFYNTGGFVETDAALMDGDTGRAGGVAAMQRVRNPILAARLVMDKTPHTLLVGATGERSLAALGAKLVDDPAAYFKPYPLTAPQPGDEHGTVGAVALDRCGHLAAGTSTGGTRHKLPGRVGDSPIIGAGTFANRRYALSATGKGELFMQRVATHDIAARAEYLGVPLQQAADRMVRELIGQHDGAPGAVIAISADGENVMSSNGYGVLYGYATEKLPPTSGARIGGE